MSATRRNNSGSQPNSPLVHLKTSLKTLPGKTNPPAARGISQSMFDCRPGNHLDLHYRH
jgi:hypothetical protein